MAKPVACKCKKTECEECPEWIFTFADLVMLMMGFFVILWVLKPSPSPKVGNGQPGGLPSVEAVDPQWVNAVISIREAFGGTPKDGSTDQIDVAMRAKRDRLTPAGSKDEGQATVKPMTPHRHQRQRDGHPAGQAVGHRRSPHVHQGVHDADA